MKKLPIPTWKYLNELFDSPTLAKSNKYEVGTVLHTANSRKFTNATILEIKNGMYTVLSDIGNYIEFSEQGLENHYLSPVCRRVKSDEDITVDQMYP